MLRSEGTKMSYTLQFDVSGVTTDETLIDNTTAFNVQWKAQNLGPDSTGQFRDRLVIRSVAECPGDDSDDNSPVVYDSDTDPDLDPNTLTESPLAANAVGPLMQVPVGPFLDSASIRMSVTLDRDGDNPVTIFNCIVIDSSS
jgi:hypothetical protein